MITPVEIKQACLKRWKDVLLQVLFERLSDEAKAHQPLFPMEILRIGKVKTKDILTNLLIYKEEINQLQKQSKQAKGRGYSIIWEEKVFDKIGKNVVPDRIYIESLEDYLFLTGNEKDYEKFKFHTNIILSSLPQLADWIAINPVKVTEHGYWPETLKVCQFFLQNPLPEMYIRQLPITVHTKFIKEENETLFRSLLDFLLPEYVNINEIRFEKRYNLRFSEPLIRIRFLDKVLSSVPGLSDISITISEFINYHCLAKHVLVTENLMNFLTLPEVPGGIALWSGGGFNVSYLKNINWLKFLQIYYWGDIDAHGFHILNQFRAYFPQTKSLMMDRQTLEDFLEPEHKAGPKVVPQLLPGLDAEESQLYQYLCKSSIRLEQEKITQAYADIRITNKTACYDAVCQSVSK